MAVSKLDNQLEQLFNNFDLQLKNPNADYSRLMEQAFKVIMLLMRKSARTDKEYVLNKGPQLLEEITRIKSTYNNKFNLAITVISSSITIAGGLTGLSGAFPGTVAGEYLATKMPAVFSSFADAGFGKTLNGWSKGMSGIGQGSGAFGGIFKENFEAKRIVYQFDLEEGKRKRQDRQESAAQSQQAQREALSKAMQALESTHRAASQIMSRG